MKKSRASSVRGEPVAKSARGMKRRTIDFSDIPELSDEQLARMRRVGRPPQGERARKLISIRLDQQVLAWLKAAASEKDQPYQTLINDILEKEMRKTG
jgi:uncharacterized protein (DUF4415 family)